MTRTIKDQPVNASPTKLSKIQDQKAKLAQQLVLLEEAEKATLAEARAASGKILAVAFSGQTFDDVSKREANRLAKRVSELGVAASLALLDANGKTAQA